MAVSKRLRYEVLRRDNHTCRYCGRSAPEVELTIDHVIPEVLGGKTAPENLVAACRDCNGGKASIAPGDGMVEDVKRDAVRWARAMELAARGYEVQILERHDQDDEFLRIWERWTLTSNGQTVALPGDWADALHRLRAAGLTTMLLTEAVDTAMRSATAVDHFRYFCGVAWRIVGELREDARRIVNAESGTPAVDQHAKDDLAAHVADALDDAGAQLEPWVYDDLVLSLAARLRGEV